MITSTSVEKAIKEVKALTTTNPASTEAGVAIRTFLQYLKFLRDAVRQTSPLVYPALSALLTALARENDALLHVLFRMKQND